MISHTWLPRADGPDIENNHNKKTSKYMKYLIIDIETGGFSKYKNGICEIAIEVLNDELKTVASYQTLIKPYERSESVLEYVGQLVSYKDDAMAIHGITMEELESEGVTKEQVIKEVALLIESMSDNIIIVGHNLEGFDYPWLVEFFKAGGEDMLSPMIESKIDTLKLFREWRGKGSKNSLSDLSREFGITNESEHRAAGDVGATAELLRILEKNGLI